MNLSIQAESMTEASTVLGTCLLFRGLEPKTFTVKRNAKTQQEDIPGLYSLQFLQLTQNPVFSVP